MIDLLFIVNKSIFGEHVRNIYLVNRRKLIILNLDFGFPESQGDALLLEVQDAMKNVQGCATIPISSLTDIPNDKIRWWHIYHNDHECVRKILLSIGSTFTNDDTTLMKSGSIVETLAYDLLLEAAMRAQHFYARNLVIEGPWKWILTEFADYYGVSESYTKLRYLSYIMNVATPTKDCLELLHELLVPVLKVRSERTLTRQEELGQDRAYISETLFTFIFLSFVLWTFHPFILKSKKIYTVLICCRVLAFLVVSAILIPERE